MTTTGADRTRTGSPATETAALPLSAAELGLWYAQRVDPDNPVFNTGQYLDLRGSLDVILLCESIAEAVADADTLATRVVETDAEPHRVIDPAARPAVNHIDVSDAVDPVAEARALMDRDMATATDPSRDPVAAQVVFTISADRHFWYQRIHHLAIDGYGTALLTRRICDLYRARVLGAEPRTPAFGRLADVVAAEADYLGSDRFASDRAFWLAQFADRPEPASLGAGVAMTAHTYLTVGVDLPDAVSAAIATLAEASAVAWPDVLVALSAAYVQRHTGGDEVVVGVPSMERLGRPAARVPAMVMNILPARVAIDEDAPLTTWLADVAKRLQRLRRHGRYRGEQVRRDLGLVGAQRRLHGPLINVLPFDDVLVLPGVDATLHVLGTGPVDDLTITWRADGSGRGLRLELDGNPQLYGARDLDAHAMRLSRFLADSATAASLARVPTLTPDEADRWIRGVNATGHDVPVVTLAQLIEARMRATPDAPALRFGRVTWSYRDLDERTMHLARLLTMRGIGPGRIVGVMAPRSLELVLALVGIVRAGAAYLPIDPEYPAERVAVMLDTSQPALVLTLGDSGHRLPANTVSLALDHLDTAASDTTVRVTPPRPEDAAYVIYTSGSTGAPKGAVIEHRAIVNRLEWMREFYEFASDDRLIQKTPATFDVSVWEFFLAFTTGAMLVVAPPDAHKDPAWLAAIIRDERVTTIHFVPSMLAAFLAEPSAARLRMRRVFCSGEELPAALRDRFHEVMDAQLHNLYGPTEAAVDVTWWNASRGDTSVPVPIGFPVWNTQMYVLDRRLRPVPPGVTGDLYIAGVQLAREYLNRPDLTSDRFVSNPFGADGSRMYKTGDLARWRPDGAITFLGRSDHQVKIRGFRIELGEIESAIASHEAVAQTAVIVREDHPGDKRLVAYVVGRRDRVDIDALRARAAARLPDYMVPSAFVVLDALPLSANGKLQRSALPAPDRAISSSARPPATETERVVLELFGDILKIAPGADGALAIGADDDFFALGGHSLLGAQLMHRVRARFAVDAGLGLLFAHPTTAQLAQRIDAIAAAAGSASLSDLGLAPMVRLATAAGREQPLFCVHPAGGLAWCYRALGRAITPRRDVFGLQAHALDPNRTLPSSLDEMAAAYVREVRAVQPHGPYALLGWSVGGILAHAMGVLLRDAGERVDPLVMLDSYPSDRFRNEPPPDERAAFRALLLVAGHDPDRPGAPALTRESVMSFLRESGHPLGALSESALDGIMRVVQYNSHLVRQHVHRPFDGDVLYFRAALDHQGTTLSPDEWRPYVRGAIDVRDVPSLHAHLTGPDAAAIIAAALSARERDTWEPRDAALGPRETP